MRNRLLPLFALVLVLASAVPSRGEVGIIVLEPVEALGFFTRVGHVGTYFSNICPDGSAVKMRLCRPGEHGGVVSKYSSLSENEHYDWAIVPFEEFMHGFAAPELAPLIGTRNLQRAIEQHTFGPLFSRALHADATGELPEGQWKTAVATRFDRTMFLFSVETAVADDATLVAAFNAAANRSRFNFFYRNCSDQARAIFDLILPHLEGIGDRTGGVTMETPKGLAKALVERGLEHPELHLRIRRYPQIPGTYGRSRAVLFPMENTYRSIAFAPWWFFGGFREVALVSMFYHQVISPFDIVGVSRDFISPTASALTVEQHRLRERQDATRRALTTAESRHAGWPMLAQLNARIVRRLGEIEEEKQSEVNRVAGTKARWRELERQFRSMVSRLGRERFVPAALAPALRQSDRDSGLSPQLIEYFETHGTFAADPARGPWMNLQLADGEIASTGVSASRILSGDPRVATLVLAAVIDYNLASPEARREDIDSVDTLFTLFRQANDAVERGAARDRLVEELMP